MRRKFITWFYLVIAGIFEVVWATLMKFSHGFTKMGFTIGTIVGMILSFLFLAQATKHMPLSLAYPIWTGIGAVGSVIVGVMLFHDKLPMMGWLFVGLLLVSIVGLKMTAGH